MLSGDCNVCINGKLPSYSETCVECGLSRKNYKPMTNADRLRSMTDEELAEHLFRHIWSCPPQKEYIKVSCGGGKPDCVKCWLDWLKQEVEDE